MPICTGKFRCGTVCSVLYLFNDLEMLQPNVSLFIVNYVMLNADRKEKL